MKKGKLIVIEGNDASGKNTQSKLLLQYFQKKNMPVGYLDFPNYQSFFGKIIARFLNGEFGKLEEVSPYLVSLPYALDQNAYTESINEQLEKGVVVIANRYLTSSMAHQSAKLPSEKREEYLAWFKELVYKEFKMLEPDLVIYLFVPYKIALNLSNKKKHLHSLDLGMDIAEKNVKHRIESEKMYLKLVEKQKNWVKINCVDKGKLLSKEEIHQKIVQELSSYLSPEVTK